MRPHVRRSLLGLAVGALVALILVGLRGTYAAQSLELKTLDWRFRTLADPARADSDIVIVDVDNLSLDLLRPSLGRYPWPRDAWVKVIQYLAAGGSRVIAFDFTFPDPDLAHPEADAAYAEAERAAGRVVQTLTFLHQLDTAEANRQAAYREDSASMARLPTLRLRGGRAGRHDRLPAGGGARTARCSRARGPWARSTSRPTRWTGRPAAPPCSTGSGGGPIPPSGWPPPWSPTAPGSPAAPWAGAPARSASRT